MNDIVEMLQLAMQAERDGFHLYSSAAAATQDAKAREIFQSLANDEIQHHNTLQNILQSYTTDGTLPETNPLTGGPSDSLSDTSPIFDEGFKQRVGQKHFEMSALSIGITLEQNSIRFYREMKEKSENTALKELFGKLVTWEKTHLDALTRQQSLLRESYWTESRFEPF